MKIFITGGTTGIGYYLAKLYLDEGHEVAICGRDLSKLPHAIQNKYPKLQCFTLDVIDLEAQRAAVNEFVGGAPLDIMVANAGRSHGDKSKMQDFGVARSILEVNTIGVLNSFECALEHMKPYGKGHLVAVASVAGFIGLPGAAAYSASKAAVLKLCESLGIDLAREGISVTAIAPGFIDTPLTQKNKHPMPFLLSGEEGARRIKRAIDKRQELYVFPAAMKVVVGALEKMPRSWYRRIMSRAKR